MTKSKAITLKGIRELDGHRCYEVEIISKALSWRLYFDEGTFLLSYWSNSTDGDFPVLTKVWNYQEINGLKFNMFETKLRNGTIFYWSEITLLEVDKEIDREVFNLPSR